MVKIICNRTTHKLELEQAFAIRKSVFIEEQRISEEDEWDGLDDSSVQFIAKNGNRVIGTARLRLLSDDCAKIERMAVLKPFRRHGAGKKILATIEVFMRKKHVQQAILHAQWAAVPFYQSCGYVKTGNPFFEAGIKHIKMLKDL